MDLALQQTHQAQLDQVQSEERIEKEVNHNDELTIEGMFQVYDKDAGTYMDVREIMDFTDEDFKDNDQIQKILSYMNTNNPIQQQQKNEDYSEASGNVQTYSNDGTLSKFSYAQLSPTGTGKNDDNLKSMAIMNNRLTQFDTLVIPSQLEEAIKNERKTIQFLSPEEQKTRLTQLAIMHNQSWQDWWETKMDRNQGLIRSIKQHWVEKVKELLNETKYQDMCADVNYQNFKDMMAPLHYAVCVQDAQIVQILIQKSAELNVQNKDGQTPLHLACQLGNLELIKIIAQEADVYIDIEDNQGNTPLHYAAQISSYKITQYLLGNCEANPHMQNFQKLKPKDVTSDPQIKKILQEYEGKVSADSNNSTRKSKVSKFLSKAIGSIINNKNKDNSDEQGQTSLTEEEMNELRIKQSQNFEKKMITIQESTVDEMDESKGICLKHFNVIERLGKGSFGSVYLVQKISTQKIFAMKILEKEKILKQNLVRYAMTERNVLCLASHPFIVSLNYAFQTTQRLYLILDYCPGGDMGMALSKQKRFTEEVARMYLCEIILAIEYLHSNNIVFRDLKPDNVVFDEDGHALLTDFGLSKEGLAGTQQSQSFCGSVAYLAPEMLKRQGHTKSIDWYLLGVLLYEMIVGVPPYFSTDRQKLFENIQGGPLKIPHTMSENARGLILQLLNRNPMKRLGAGHKDSEEIKSHIFFRDVDWKMVLEKRQPVPPARIRKIEPNPISIQSFIMEEQKVEAAQLQFNEQQQQQQQPQQQNLSPTNKNLTRGLFGKKQQQEQPQSLQPGNDNNQQKIPGWSYIKK